MLAANPAEVARYKAGETKLMGFFVGQVMKRSKGKADPKGVQPVLAGEAEVTSGNVTLSAAKGTMSEHGPLRFVQGDRLFPSFTRLIGSTEIAPYRMIQCRCGPVTRPLRPTAPIR